MAKSVKEKQPGKSKILKNVATRDIHLVKGSNYIMTLIKLIWYFLNLTSGQP